MSHFDFKTEWVFVAPIEAVWDKLNDPEGFAEWWPGFESATRISGDGEPGSVLRCFVRGQLGLQFHFDLIVQERRAPTYLLLLSKGDLEGKGEWILNGEGGQVHVQYNWSVSVKSRWLRALASIPTARRFMESSHARVMKTGYENLTQLLESADTAC